MLLELEISRVSKFAIKRLGYEAILTKNIETIRGADKVIFPGVGEASSAMMKLIDSGLHTLIPSLTQPVLGICLGDATYVQIFRRG